MVVLHGKLRTAEGRRFGFELTFFRRGVDREADPTNVWDVRDLWMAHLALSDIEGGQFLHTERLNRSGPGLQARISSWLAFGMGIGRRSGPLIPLSQQEARRRFKRSPTAFPSNWR